MLNCLAVPLYFTDPTASERISHDAERKLLPFLAESHSKSQSFRLPVKLTVDMLDRDGYASVTQSMQAIPEETLKPGITCTNSGMQGGIAGTRDNPGKPSILGRYANWVQMHQMHACTALAMVENPAGGLGARC